MTTHRARLPKLPIYARWPWGPPEVVVVRAMGHAGILAYDVHGSF